MTETTHAESSEKKGLNFVEEIVVEDLKAGKNDGRLQTRFRRNLTDICISDMQKRSVWTSASRKNTAACVI